MSSLSEFYLNDNHSLNNIPAEMSQCPVLAILSVENCPLRDLPQPIVSGGSAMIIYVSRLCNKHLYILVSLKLRQSLICKWRLR